MDEELQGLLSAFLNKWPIARLKTMSLNDYVQGGSWYQETFCYWVETVTKPIGNISGMGGGGSFKFGIFYMSNRKDHSKSSRFDSDTEYAWIRKYGQTRDEAYEKIKSIVIATAENAESGNFESIDKLDFYEPVKWKIAAMYAKGKLPFIFSRNFLEVLSNEYGIELDVKKTSTPSLYAFLINVKDKQENILSYSRTLWELYEKLISKDVKYYIVGSKYGTKDVFPDFLEQSVIATGFAEDFDMSEYASLDDYHFSLKLKESGYGSNDLSALKLFRRMKPGDRIAIKADGSPKGTEGFLSIVGIAEVIEVNGSVYEYDPEGLAHLIHVDFIKAPVYKEFALGGYGRTVHWVQKEDVIKLLFDIDKYDLIPQINRLKSTIDMSLNTILYGPPGTGKTYNTINYALSIAQNTSLQQIMDEEQALGRKAIIDRFEIFKSKGFIEFITFHQNYSYEEFVQGLRPVVGNDGKEPDNLKFSKQDGVFKKISDRALRNLVGEGVEEEQELTFDEMLNKFLEPLKLGQEIEIDLATAGYKFNIYKEEEKYIVFRNSAGNSFKINKIFLEKAFNQGTLTGIIAGGLATYYAPVLNKLKKIKEEAAKKIVPIEPHNFVLIIDEINRANISRVFGELITLIEEDKRWDNDEKMKVKLPSGDEFTVPKNLYIIGTMNTADKSIALLDIALRRRFEFIPLYPDESKVVADYLPFFSNINSRIKKERGADFAIGHAYFMNSAKGKSFDFPATMNKKVIPLLNEYFHSAKEGMVKEIVNGALNISSLSESFVLMESALGILKMEQK